MVIENAESWLEWLFWFSLGILLYTFIGYPLLVKMFAMLFPGHLKLATSASPSVTVVMAAYNEEKKIQDRLQNLLSSTFPEEKLSIIVVSDGATDGTVEKVRSLNNRRIHLIVHPERSGKAHCLNVGVAAAQSEFVVLADVRQRFDPATISKLIHGFADPRVGAVSGALVIESATTGIGGGVDTYWRLEKFLRFEESRFDSCIGCTGAVCAIRRSLFKSLPVDTLLDDVVIPMGIAIQGYRVIFEPEAIAYDPQSLDPAREKLRKQRTLAGNYQILFRYPSWLFPWRNRLWWQLISHKYLRLAAPAFMLSMLITNMTLLNIPFYRFIFGGQCLFYFLALIGSAFTSLKVFVFSIPAGFVFLNLMSLNGLFHYLCGSYRRGIWPVARVT